MRYEHFKTPKKVLRFWKHGWLGKREFHFLLFQTLTPENLEEFLRIVPPDILEELKRVAGEAPTTDEAWSETISIRSWCGPWNEEIAARVREEEEQASRRYRAGIETLRGFLQQE
jgi:hypothetical protein